MTIHKYKKEREHSPTLPIRDQQQQDSENNNRQIRKKQKIESSSNEKSSTIQKVPKIDKKKHNSDDELDESYLNNSYTQLQERMKNKNQDQNSNSNINFEHSPQLFNVKKKHNLSWDELDIMFEEELWNVLNFDLHLVCEDGSCMFRSIAHQVYGDESFHLEVRRQCCDYMLKNADYYQNFLGSDENILDYIDRKRKPGVFGNHIELQAMSEMYNRPIEIYEYCCTPLKCLSTRNSASLSDPIRL